MAVITPVPVICSAAEAITIVCPSTERVCCSTLLTKEAGTYSLFSFVSGAVPSVVFILLTV
ncbi:hypothetical protein D3C80_1628670 [compost metagenome]